MASFLLKFLDLFEGLFRLAKVNYAQLRVIVDAKLMMDNRRQIVSYRKKDQKNPQNTFVWTLVIYTFFGLFIAIALYNIPSFGLSMVVYFSYVMVMIAMTLITDFSSVMLDTSDNTILLPRPVDGRTLFAARLTHIFLYIAQIVLGLAIFPAVVVLVKYSLFMCCLFAISTILAVVIAVFITNTFYLLILQFADEEKLKNVINYFQIGMAVFVMGGYQLLPRVAGGLDLSDYAFTISTWMYFVPPYWLAISLEAFYLRAFDTPHIVNLFLATTVPISGIWLVSRYLTPVFNHKLAAMSVEVAPRKHRHSQSNFIERISKWLTTTGLERGAFELIYLILGRDRKIKLKIYPAYGYIIVFGLIFIFRGKQDFMATWNSLPDTNYHLLLLYFAFMILQVAFYEIPFSDDFKASWVYYSAPIDRPGYVLTAMLKAIMVRLFIPGYIVISTVVLLIWKFNVLDDVIFALLNNILMLTLIAFINKRSLPFSMAPSVRNQSGTFARSILLVLLIGALGFGHYALTNYPTVLMSAIPLQLVVIITLFRIYQGTKWSQLSL